MMRKPILLFMITLGSVLLGSVMAAGQTRLVIAGQDSLQDFGVNQFYPDSNFSTVSISLIGNGSAGSRELRYAISCVLPNITAGQVTSCSLLVYMTNDQGTTLPLYRAAPITQQWTLTEATWNSRKTGGAWTTAGITAGTPTDSLRGSGGDSIYYKWDVTRTIRDQLNGTAFGVRIAIKDTAVYPFRQTWATEDHATAGLRPYFVLNYSTAQPAFRRPGSGWSDAITSWTGKSWSGNWR